MTPYERTLNILIDLDDLLSQFDEGDHSLDKKITHSVRWINSNLEHEIVLHMLKAHYFENKDVIIDLLKEKAFNPKEYD